MQAEDFLSKYEEEIFTRALVLREVVLAALPNITEQVDLPAKMVAYVYGQKYIDMICTIIPSKKGLKLGFAYGSSLPDPDGLLEGNGKLSRYVVILSEKQIRSAPIKKLLKAGLALYHERTKS